jgi:hypothetical protein
VPLVTNVLLGADLEKKRRIFVWSGKDANLKLEFLRGLFFLGQPNIQQ